MMSTQDSTKQPAPKPTSENRADEKKPNKPIQDPHDEGPKWPGGGKKGENEK